MSSLCIRLGQTRSFNSESRSKLSQRSSSNKNQMQLIRQAIDSNLKKAHEKLKIDGFIRLKQKNSSINIENSTAQLNYLKEEKTSRDNVKLISLKRRNNFSANGQYYTPIVKQRKNLHLKDEITLVNNRIVMEYIQLIYETYNIKDPLKDREKTHSESTIEKNQSKFSNFDEYDSINSARTMKEKQQNIVQVSEFDVDQQLEMKKTANKKNKKNNKILITLRTNSAQKTQLKHPKRTKNNPLFQSQVKKHFQNIIKSKNEIKQNLSQNQAFVPMIRYCFACQQPIFEQNLKRHQSECHILKQALTWSFYKIIKILDQKIERIVNQIKSQIINVSLHTVNRHYQQLQGHINSLIMHDSIAIKPIMQTNKPYKRQKIKEFQDIHERIKKNIDSNYYSKFELLNKLSWFTKLRDNIQTRYISI